MRAPTRVYPNIQNCLWYCNETPEGEDRKVDTLFETVEHFLRRGHTRRVLFRGRGHCCIEEAGIHSGDSSCVPPSQLSTPEIIETMKEYTSKLGFALGVRRLINVQFAVQNGKVYVLEVNPRATRTVPFVSKATGVPLAKIAVMVMVGRKLRDLNIPKNDCPKRVSIKESVFPFSKFPRVNIFLGPEMRSTGEVMGISETFGGSDRQELSRHRKSTADRRWCLH